jgi:thiosulfate/3-mercaptopyruvate sulfurtransferase
MSTRNVDSPLISAAALGALLDAPGLIVVDCRFDLANPGYGPDAYAAGHVPGALFSPMEHDLAAPRTAGTGRHPLPSAQQFAAVLGRWGFTDASHVIGYDQASGAWASRLWWMLRARGHRHVQVLDGGWAAWLAAGGPVSTTLPEVVPSTVAPRPFAGAVDAGQVAAGVADGHFALIDARAADRFQGRNETIDPVAGHVPGAINHPYSANLDAQQRWLTAEELRQRWAPTLARAQGKPLVAMCGSGVTACHNLLALEHAGITGAKLYPGSWSEWSSDPDRPVGKG